jgi:type II secretory pathway component PulJ
MSSAELRPRSARTKHARDVFVPVLLLATSIIASLAFQTSQLYRDRTSLQQAKGAQQQAFEESRTLRAQLDGVAADTARLAQQGNANAQRVVEELRKRGITINPQASAPPPDPVQDP